MTIKERFLKWKTTESAKLKTMSFRQKLSYILYYYKGWIIGFIIFLMFAGYVGDAVSQAHKEVVIQGFFTNDDYGLFNASKIEKEYGSTLELSKKQCVIFDDALYIDLGGEATEYTAASNGKLIAYMATNELDFVVTTQAVLEHYLDQAPMLDFQNLLDEATFQRFQDYMYSYNGSYVALDMSQSRFIRDVDYDMDETYYMFVPMLAPNPNQICDFIAWCFE
jgi:hypothetical protein